jgi:nucleoside-diphosphate-sugar epimerase
LEEEGINLNSLPDTINSAEELDEVLSRPSEPLVRFVERLEGDILILGAGGKIGPTMARMAKRAVDAAGGRNLVIAVDVVPLPELESLGIKVIACDLLDLRAVEVLPRVPNVVFMAGRKFGTSGDEPVTWAVNVIVPYHVARAFTGSRIAAFSTGCVYPLMHVSAGGATEQTPVNPIGEYAQSCLGRERMFDYFSGTRGEKVVHIRLNYAAELRYGVLFDVARKVWAEEPVDVTTGYANVIWQGDACNQALQALELASSPPVPLNITGPETISIRDIAEQFGKRLAKKVKISGRENGIAYLSNASAALSRFGRPAVSVDQMVDWIAHWLKIGGSSLGKPTHYETQDGRF